MRFGQSLLKLLYYQTQIMIQSEVENPETRWNMNPASDEIQLQAEMIRIKANLHLKMAQQMWELQEEQLLEFFNNYETMPFTQITAQMLFKIQRVKMVRTKQKLFFGETYNKKKQGKGISIHRMGKIYEGQFHLNEKAGFGVEVYQNGNVYIGNFSQNKKHGKGSFFWFNLSELELEQNIQQYHGDWWGGLPDGLGQHFKVNGDVYVGKFKNGLKHGEGTQMYGNGDKYKGQFINGLPEGYGEYTWADGSTYKGDFKQGSRNGYGTWKSKKQNGEVYKGHYMLDKKHGYGIYDWGNGYVYKGFWMDDLRYGQGTLLFNGLIQYDGYWENGQKVDHKPEPANKQSRIHETTQTSAVDETKTIGTQSRYTDRGFNNQTKRISRENNSAQKQKSASKHQFSMSFHRENSHQKSKCGHKNCIPVVEIGKMPRPPWKNAWKK